MIVVRKVRFSIFLLLCMNFVGGCKNKDFNLTLENEKLSMDYYTVDSDYDFKNAIEDGYVVYTHSGIENEDRIEEFYQKYLDNKDGVLTIVKYTVEGDPMVIQYVYKDNVLMVYEDYTRDSYGSNGEVTVKSIKTIELEVDDTGHISIIEKCL
ncbi:MAG TPA: hypothetical protein DCE23_09160 [Firmicutes bacterium]|nr:hypothetical protein [Bacillota bacterium]